MVDRKKLYMPIGRTIVVDGRTWKYKIGRQNVVARSFDSKEKRVIDFCKLTGTSWSDIERGQWRGGFSIEPKEIAVWLKST